MTSKATLINGILLASCGSLGSAGCTEPVNEFALRQRAVDGLKAGVRYAHNPAVRAQAIEALQQTAPEEGVLWFQTALRDEHPGVRFAGCMALGAMRHPASREMLLTRVHDEDARVQAAAIYSLHRIGDTEYTGRLAELLLRHKDPQVRNNAAYVLGELGEAGAIPILRRAVHDEEVALQAVEAMAKLGDDRAFQQLTIFTHDYRGDRRIVALNALGALRDPKGLKAIELQYIEASMIEVRLAAARAMGCFGRKDGLRFSLDHLDFTAPSPREDDPAANQIMRIRSMAALALGAIGDRSALPKLQARLDAQDDPRVQVAAAKAILEIIRASGPTSAVSAAAVARSAP